MLSMIDELRQRAGSLSKRIIYSEPQGTRLFEALGRISQTRLARPVLIGDAASIGAELSRHGLSERIQVMGMDSQKTTSYARVLREDWGARGIGELEIREYLGSATLYAVATIRAGEADALILGSGTVIGSDFHPIVRGKTGQRRLWRSYLVVLGDRSQQRALLFADIIGPTGPRPSELADIASRAGQLARRLLATEPSIAFLAPNVVAELKRPDKFNSAAVRLERRVAEAVVTLRTRDENLAVDSTMHAVLPSAGNLGAPNTFVFVDTQIGDVRGQLERMFNGSRVLGPTLHGSGEPVSRLQVESSVEDIVDLTAITALV